MEQIVIDAESLAQTLTKLNASMRDTKIELARRLGREQVAVRGYIAPKDTTLAPRTLLDSILRTKLVELSVIVPRLRPQIESVEAFISQLDQAPMADDYQRQRIHDLKYELSTKYGIEVSRKDILQHLWKRSTR